MKKMLFIVIFISAILIGYSQIKNPNQPIKGKWDFKMNKVWEVEEAGEDVLGEIQVICTADNGNAFVADSKNERIYIFNSKGKFLSSFGKRGQGPGEIRHYRGGGQLHVVNNRVIFVDRGILHYFTLDGKYEHSVRYSTQLNPRFFISEDEFLSAPVSTFGLQDKTAKIVLYNLKDKSQQTIAKFQPYSKASSTSKQGDRQSTVVAIFGGITPLMLVKNRNDKLYYGMSNQYKVYQKELKGNKSSSFSLEGRKSLPITTEVKKELSKGMGDVPKDLLKPIMDGLPSHASFFSDFVIDKNGAIYVLDSQPLPSSIQNIDIFSPKGKYIYSAKIQLEDEQKIQYVYLKDEILILATENEDGDMKITKYQISLPQF